MFNFDELDKRKTYLGLQYGTSLIAKQIVKYSKCYAPNSDKIPTHVCALKWRYGTWWIFDSHAKGNKKFGVPKGVRRIRRDIWEKIEKRSEFCVFPMQFDLRKLEDYVGQSYGLGDIKSLMCAAFLKNNGKQKDRKGLICSEYLALCNDKICKYYDLPAYCITPAHFQNYVDYCKINNCVLDCNQKEN